MKKRMWFAVALAAALSMGLAATLVATERSEVSDMNKWDVTALYPDQAAFLKVKDGFLADAERLNAFKGHLGDSPQALKDALDTYYALELTLRHMETYVGCLVDQDTRVSANKAEQAEVQTIRARFSGIGSFIDPEIIAVGAEKIEQFLAAEPGLAPYAFPLRETLRRQKHILSGKEERILAATQDIADAGYNIYNMFTNADLPREDFTLADGSTVKLNYANFDILRRSPVDDDRRRAFPAFFGQYDRFRRSIAQMLYSQIKTYTFYAQMRGYPSNLAAALDGDNIDPRVYTSLIEAAHQNFATLHRYLRLKARVLGKDRLEYTDIYLPFTKEVAIPVNWTEAQGMLLNAFEPLGREYVEIVRGAFQDGWVDVYPNEGKDEGAYSNGWAYDAHPYVLMNFNDTFGETLTLAHEMGHAMHSYFSNQAQPFATSDYSTFVAEVASTFNENLLNDYALRHVASDEERLYLLGNFLDGTIKGTFFRQVQFAEFELRVHELVSKGEAVTDEDLNRICLELTREYYGQDQGITDVPDYMAAEWAYVPHFYYNFYVYQYSTSVAAASLLAKEVISGTPGARERYFDKLLRAGGSNYPMDILRAAGADMADPATYQALMERANRYMDEVEKILDRKEKG